MGCDSLKDSVPILLTPPAMAQRWSLILYMFHSPYVNNRFGIVYYDRMGHCPRWTRQFFFASGAASPARRLQILRRRVHLGQVPQRGGGGVVMRVILAKKCRKMHWQNAFIIHHRTFGFRRVIDRHPHTNPKFFYWRTKLGIDFSFSWASISGRSSKCFRVLLENTISLDWRHFRKNVLESMPN